ncbi:MAG: DEAD/DEAH box helicase [Porticoccaceae bacterium]|jgi:ATP-dependent RNA helicase RhlE|nr:DEAD/DEAH box helicase [Porticoccaceae bacterium]MEA3299414.1 DEAD/DEAH box helicase [Pseudomonadota bacterium]HLS99387.1 DEAD/DEAH box helicase [Porticoccaceae bacterium]
MSFASLGLSAPLIAAIAARGYRTPTPIQGKAIPAILAGRDLLAAAETGTGKTAGFTLPMLERLAQGQRAGPNQARALVLVPTRELAAQVHASVVAYGAGLPLRAAVAYGGVKINPQMMAMRRGVDVLVATPGRLLDLHANNAVRFDFLEILVLDEADRMLDLGFLAEIGAILALLPKRRQNLLFSATFSDPIRTLARGLLHNPLEISVNPRASAARTVRHWLCPVDKKRKAALFIALIREQRWGQVLVFTKTREGADRLSRQLQGEGIAATAIHGDKSQGARTAALAAFKAGEVQVLVATDLAARGLDIDQLPRVVNFDLPKVAADYIHRIGRTGRAGQPGEAISLVCADEFPLLAAIEQLLGQVLPRELVDGFEPNHDLPPSRTPHPPKKAKKPKKPRHTGTAAPSAHPGSGKSPAPRAVGSGTRGKGGGEKGGKNRAAGKRAPQQPGSARSRGPRRGPARPG